MKYLAAHWERVPTVFLGSSCVCTFVTPCLGSPELKRLVAGRVRFSFRITVYSTTDRLPAAFTAAASQADAATNRADSSRCNDERAEVSVTRCSLLWAKLYGALSYRGFLREWQLSPHDRPPRPTEPFTTFFRGKDERGHRLDRRLELFYEALDQGWGIPVLEGRCVCRFLFTPITQAKWANWLCTP